MRVGHLLVAVVLAACEGSMEPIVRPTQAEPEEGAELMQLTHGTIALDPAWSPDGAWIAYTSLSSWTVLFRAESIVMVPADGSAEPVVLVENGTYPVWRP